MGIADDMKRIAENIVASYDGRVRVLGDLVADTKKTLVDARRTVKGFTQTRKEMSEEQAKNLADFVKDLTKNVGNMLKGFRKNHKEMSGTQAESLSSFVKDLAKNVGSMLKTFQKDRGKMSEELKETLAKAVKEIETYVKRRLKEFNTAHAAMSEALRKDLTKFVKDVASDVKNILDGARKLVGEYKADMSKTRDVWQRMESSLAKSKKVGVMPQLEAGKKVTTVEETARKPRKKGRRRKRGRRKK